MLILTKETGASSTSIVLMQKREDAKSILSFLESTTPKPLTSKAQLLMLIA
jgi:hypothetical protein